MGISGKAGNLRGKKIDGGNVFEGPRQQEYPTPPLKHSYASSMFEEAVRKLGYHPYPTPAANLSETYKNPDGVTRAGMRLLRLLPALRLHDRRESAADQHADAGARASARISNCAREAGCGASCIRTAAPPVSSSPTRTARNSSSPPQPSILASFTLNNTRLLSAFQDRHAVRSGHAQRHARPQPHAPGGSQHARLLRQAAERVHGSRRARQRASPISTATSDSAAPKTGLLRVGMIAVQQQWRSPIGVFRHHAAGRERNPTGARSGRRLRSNGTIDSPPSSMSGEHLSYRQNYMDLDPTYTDKFGDPLLRFTLDWTDHEYKQREFAVQIQAKIAREMGAKFDDGHAAPRPLQRDQLPVARTSKAAPMMGSSPETAWSIVISSIGTCRICS